ncbi:uncharacterized protein UV8b_01731 [Ustilaginoidea virens]|uniref:FAD-binding domain-containing protein n=1 Tax=Ustilaginoidea virens TaxID=1159556 RepID=A0A8E5HLK1_USTVR|nr:uncharacterized protein UV8b_01731 [Ustilaginoidea virens]QUC17490.1 hypothetical protein UV8b_01731 [Ustilaginoidea virens]
MPKPDLSYAIIGGGISGIALAIALHRSGVDVRIFEQASQFKASGAGVSFTPNALQAMQVCHPAIYEAFQRVCTRNIWPSKQKVWFDYYDHHHASHHGKPAFSITNQFGQNSVHRARFIDELVKLLPADMVSFDKRLDRYEEQDGGRYRLHFADGSTHVADGILACDGIKSRVRQLMFRAGHPCATPSYTYKYAYRALVPMEDAVWAMGEEKAQNAAMHLGAGGHVLTFPVNHGKTVNVVAFRATQRDWPNSARLTAESTREAALRDFAHLGPEITALLRLTNPKLDVWAIFDLGDNPPPTLSRGGVCLVGDAAHATSPHHGAGAGFCIEDAAVLAHLLSDKRVADHVALRVALQAYSEARRERASWLVQSSRHMGNMYEWLAPGIQGLAEVEEEIKCRNGVIADVDVAGMCGAARELFARGYDMLQQNWRNDKRAGGGIGCAL